MSGRSSPFYCTLILIIMHSYQSLPNIPTVVHSYEDSTNVDKSTIEPYKNRDLGRQKNVGVYCTISLIAMHGYRTKF